MKMFSIKNLNFIPAGHENAEDPGVVKKVILTVDDVEIKGTIQMINWAKMKPKKKFSRHYHQKMDEIFIILSGKAEIEIGNETIQLEATDTVCIPQKIEHEMKNIGVDDIEYIVIGIVTEAGGKTVVVGK